MKTGSSFSTWAKGAIVAGSLIVLAAAVHVEERAPVPRGRLLFESYCTSCHGAGGMGDGHGVESLGVPVPDLTLLSRRNHGTFPQEETSCTIDGRSGHRPQGSSKMPIWGLSLQNLDQDTNQEEEVRSQIGELVLYLESIQCLD